MTQTRLPCLIVVEHGKKYPSSSVFPLSRVPVLKYFASGNAGCVRIIVFMIILTFDSIEGSSLIDLYVEPLKLEILSDEKIVDFIKSLRLLKEQISHKIVVFHFQTISDIINNLMFFQWLARCTTIA